jgi:tetratricopeptide (TPR) repeat protein
MVSTASLSNDHMTAVSAMLRDAAQKAKCLGPDDSDTYVATSKAIVAHIEQQIRNLDSTCCAAIAFEHVADAFASKQVWEHARETYSLALQVIYGTEVALNESAMQHQPACCCTFTVLQKFAAACMHLKDYDSAWKAHQECLDIVQPMSFPISDSRIVTVVGNMGHVQYAKGGAAAVRTSITLYKQCLRLQRSLSSRDLLAEANTLSKIGFIFRQGGRLDTAITWYEDALEVRTEVLGDDHVGLSSDLLAIGNSTTVRENFTAPLLPFQSACRLTAPHLLTAA